MKIVVSGVNMVEGGILSILKDALQSLKGITGITVLVLVHKKELIGDLPANFEVREYPEVKSAWNKRLEFEWKTSKAISDEYKPDLWIALHDITPRINCPVQVVYCHNPSPFYKLDVKRFFYDVKFSLFCLFYKYLYSLNIRRNKYVIVQQQWIREYFEKNYGVKTIVAHPFTDTVKQLELVEKEQSGVFNFFYPSFPRIFKNIETLCAAAEVLAKTNPRFELWLTMNGTENKYAKVMAEQYKHIPQIKFLGLQNRGKVEELYGLTDCLVFPSRLETWGLPLSEFMAYEKPILAADLPYAHETAGKSPSIRYFNPDKPEELALRMAEAIKGKLTFDHQPATEPTAPFFIGWDGLLRFLISQVETQKEAGK